MATETFVLIGAAPDQRITELHAWIATHENGGEGVMSADLPLGHMPLVTGKHETAEKLGAFARMVQRKAAEMGAPVTIELRTFRAVPS
jgi:hypothetical protein